MRDRRTQQFGNRRADVIWAFAVGVWAVGSVVVVAVLILTDQTSAIAPYMNNVVLGFFFPASLAVLVMLFIGSLWDRTVPREKSQ